MKVNDLEDIVGRVSLDFFEYKNPGFSAMENPGTVHKCIDDVAFIISRFIEYFNKLAEEQLNESGR
jgi:hypothetical protein